jgi:hypothetical protein
MKHKADELQDYFLAGIVHALKAMKELQATDTDSLDSIDFDYLINRRMRDMIDINILDNIERIDSEEFK